MRQGGAGGGGGIGIAMQSRQRNKAAAAKPVLPSLALLLQALEGKVIALELKTGALVRGTLVEVDTAMKYVCYFSFSFLAHLHYSLLCSQPAMTID